MANIFPTQKLAVLATKADVPELEEKLKLVNLWLEDYRTGSLKTDKETSREQAYNQDIFIKILGYKEKPSNPYSFEPKASTAAGQLPDAIVGHLTKTADNLNQIVSAVIELKGAAILLDKPQRREGNMSPVQQGFKYKIQYKHCPFVIVSNFYEFRLYQDNQLDYEVWTLQDLANPKDNYLKFKTFYYLLNYDNFVPTNGGGKSKTEELLSDIRIEQEDIGKKFYRVYKLARDDLLRNLYKNNVSVRADIDLGIEKAQKIIDRIVFACFAEDRGLLPDNTLQRVLKVDESAFGGLWDTLKGFFNAIDTGSAKLEIPDGYNGGLFAVDNKLNELVIDDEPLKALAELSRYDFQEELSVQILGHIFEQSISDLEAIKKKANEAIGKVDIETTNKRKKDGIYYTPDYIVKYIVENSLGVYLKEAEDKCKQEAGLKGDINDKNYDKRERKAYLSYQKILQEVTVCDPACGSGAFLVQVFDYLLAENKRVADILDVTNTSLFNTEEHFKSILENNIYGVDLNGESVEITKLSLWLKSAQKGKKLTNLNSNIKCGNSLIDDPAIAGDKAFNWQEQFPEVFEQGGFDVVVGNPPYVRQELLSDQKPHFAERYQVYSNTTDLFAYFYEKALNILKPNGLMSYISNTFAKTTGAGIVLRKYLQENSQIVKLLDFGTFKVFDGATTYPIILVIRNSKISSELEYFLVGKQDLGALDVGFISGNIIINQKSLAPESWIFDNSNSSALREKLSKLEPVNELFGKTYYGIKTSLNEAFIISEHQKSAYIAQNLTSNEVIQPFWEGKDLSRWSSAVKDKYVIIFKQGSTKQMFGDLSEQDALERMTQKYSSVMRHLNRFEIAAKKRYDKGDYWWELRACAYYPLFDKPKITWPNLQNAGKFSYDDTGKYINAPAVILPSNDKTLLAILNSKVVWFFLKGICVARSGGYLEVKPQYFAQIPIPEFTDVQREDMAVIVSGVLELNKNMHGQNTRFQKLVMSELAIEKWPGKLKEWWKLDFNDFVKALKLKLNLAQKDDLLMLFEKYQPQLAELKAKIDQTDKEIDQMVYKLYNLTPEEIQLIEE